MGGAPPRPAIPARDAACATGSAAASWRALAVLRGLPSAPGVLAAGRPGRGFRHDPGSPPPPAAHQSKRTPMPVAVAQGLPQLLSFKRQPDVLALAGGC